MHNIFNITWEEEKKTPLRFIQIPISAYTISHICKMERKRLMQIEDFWILRSVTEETTLIWETKKEGDLKQRINLRMNFKLSRQRTVFKAFKSHNKLNGRAKSAVKRKRRTWIAKNPKPRAPPGSRTEPSPVTRGSRGSSNCEEARSGVKWRGSWAEEAEWKL